MGLLSWVIVGGLAGWISSKIMNMDQEINGFMNVLVGIVGGVVGGWVMSLISKEGVSGFNIWSLIVAIIGSCICLFLYKKLRK